jgi:hypothetical protein
VATTRLTLGALLPLVATGCLIVGEHTDESGEAFVGTIIPVGQVHGCAISAASADVERRSICFASELHIERWAEETMEACDERGTPCEATCSRWSLHPCVLACPGSGLSRGCNATHGCYCPAE